MTPTLASTKAVQRELWSSIAASNREQFGGRQVQGRGWDSDRVVVGTPRFNRKIGGLIPV